MTNEALTALKASIAHWERLATGKRRDGESTEANHCALCNLFQNKTDPTDGLWCCGCPVKKATGLPSCFETPFKTAEYQRLIYGFEDERFKSAALDELNFLKSLLPKRKKKGKV